VVVDADLGVSGRFGSDRGYRQIVAGMCMGEVGAVFGLEVSRFGRSNADVTRLMELARLTDTLLIDTDGVYDLANVNDRILLGLKGQMSEIELHFLLGRLHGAKLAAATAASCATRCRSASSTTKTAPSSRTRTSRSRAWSRTCSPSSTAPAPRWAWCAPSPPPAGCSRNARGVVPGPASSSGASSPTPACCKRCKNPTYAGAYTFGKTRDVRQVQPDGSVRSSRRKRAREEWTVLIDDHHDGYLSWADYLAIEAKLAANATQKRARPVREGTAVSGRHLLWRVRWPGRYPLRPA
jgi:hypothetical protein